MESLLYFIIFLFQSIISQQLLDSFDHRWKVLISIIIALEEYDTK